MTSSLQIAEMIKRLEKVFLAKHFDLVLVYGDTNSTFAGAFSAKQNNLKIGHIEAGLRSYDKNMPEEINRVLTDHISEFLYVPTQNAIHNLKHENLKNIIYTGDISVEIIERAIKLKLPIIKLPASTLTIPSGTTSPPSLTSPLSSKNSFRVPPL